VLISESQERMLAIVHPDRVADVLAVCAKWGLTGSRVGMLRAERSLRVSASGRVVAHVPPGSLVDEGPTYDRPAERPGWLDALRAKDPCNRPAPGSFEDAFLAVLGSPNVASKRWVAEQYDQLVQGQTVAGPGGDAAVIRLEGTLKAVAVTSDGNGRYGWLDPYLGGAHAVAEAARNVACTGATPLAITNCLNFGNPEDPHVMWQFVEAIRGIGDACRDLGTPVTGGNVSFYNASGGTEIWPTPVVGMLGLLEDHRLRVSSAFPEPDLLVYLLGETKAELGGGEYADAVLGMVSGRPPALDLEAERRLISLLTEGASRDLLASAHDCSDGGIAIAAAESSIAGGIGLRIGVHGTGLPDHVVLFSESASRALVSVWPGREREFEALAEEHGVPAARVGITGGNAIDFDGLCQIPVREALVVYEGAIPSAMAAGRPPA
jgi:phosphoribosylformylglycinamidine synthase II